MNRPFEQVCLMLGAGHAAPTRRMKAPTSAPEDLTGWETLDMNPLARPTILFNLEGLQIGERLPRRDNFYDEIHAYEVLEHFGRQGDFRGLFRTFGELWRVLQPGGILMGTCPSRKSRWAWGDPGHTRIISYETLCFLTKDHYDQLGKTSSSDYRDFVDPCWWVVEHSEENEDSFIFGLRKVAT